MKKLLLPRNQKNLNAVIPRYAAYGVTSAIQRKAKLKEVSFYKIAKQLVSKLGTTALLERMSAMPFSPGLEVLVTSKD